MALIELIEKDIIKTPIISEVKSEIIRELLEVLKKAGKISEIDKAYDAVIKREDLSSTGLEQGVAVPHAKTDAVKGLTIAIGIAPQGVDFNSFDGLESKLFFLILAPPDQSGPHIAALAEIARLTKSKTFCKLLINAESSEEVVEIFQGE